MSTSISDMKVVASQIKEATKHGENTALRVGGLLVDMVDYLDTLHNDEITLGPLLTALNNSNLIDPADGQTLTFSILEDNWTFSSAITQLKIAQGRIESTVASNYQTFLDSKTYLQSQLDEEDQRIRNNYAEYSTWKVQTDTYIAQYATAYDEEGNLVAMSEILQQADQIQMEVDALEERVINLAEPDSWEQGDTDNEEAGETYAETKVDSNKVIRISNLLPISQDACLTFNPENNNYAIQVLYFNKDKVYCSSATHWRDNWTLLSEVEEGKLKIINQTDVQYIAIKIRKYDGSENITVDDVKNVGLSLSFTDVVTMSEVKITATEISQTVADSIAKDYMDDLKSLIHPDSLPDEQGNYVYATWKTQTNDTIGTIAGKWDEDGNLIGYSTTTQTAEMISSAVSDAKDYTDQLKSIINSDVLKDDSGNYAYATFKQQTNDSISTIAGKWDNEGNLIGYSTTKQTADMISSAVSDAEDYTDQLKALINSDVLKDEQGNYAYTTFKTQTNDAISTIAGKWDEEGNLIGYSTTTQTATMIKTTVEGYGYITAEDLPDMTKYYTKTQIDQTVDTINLSVKAAKDEADAIAEDYVTSADISLFITADEAGTLISNANIKADKIKFDVTFDWTVKNSNDETIFNLDSNGNLTIAGEFNGGSITDGIEISGSGSQRNKMKIVPAGVNGAALIGISNNNEVINLSFDNSNAARMIIKDISNNIKISSSRVEITTTTASGTMFTEIGNSGSTSYARFVANNKDLSVGVANDGTINIGGDIWPSSTSVAIGYIYKDNNGYLRVK